MTEDTIPYGRQWVDETDLACVADVLRGDFLTTGPMVAEFEAALSGYTGAGYAVALNSGTAALHAAYAAAGIGPGDEVVTPTLTFAATANAALYLGADVRFADVVADTGNLDPASVEEQLTERTRLIVAVDYAGHPADYDELERLARPRGIPIVADAAHSLGATYRGRRVGTLAGLSTLSFHPVKAITTGEGGAVLTDDAGWRDRAATFRTHGITRDREVMEADDGPWYYEMQELGFNYRLTDVQSALGISQLRRLDDFLARRRAIAARYLEAFVDLAHALELPVVRDGVEPAWHLFVVRVREAARRRGFFDRLRALGLGVQVHYVPVDRHPFYRVRGIAAACPRADDFYARAVSLPIFPRMSDHEVERVVELVHRAVRDSL